MTRYHFNQRLMATAKDIENDIQSTLDQTWEIRDGQVVPNTNDVALSGGGVRLKATILYADLADSTELAMWDRRVTARICKAYLAASSRLIRHHGGHVRSFDGDRVMGIFVGKYMNTSATKCALRINWMFSKVLRPRFEAKYKALRDGSFHLAQGTGIDVSDVLVVRSGIRNNNDLIWIGRAPNVAAKLSSIREPGYSSYISAEVFNVLADEAKFSKDRRNMWESRIWNNGPIRNIYRSNWSWSL